MTGRQRHMTYREAIADFKENIVPVLRERYGKMSKLTRTTVGSAWVDYVDGLERSGQISERQADMWDNPFNPGSKGGKRW